MKDETIAYIERVTSGFTKAVGMVRDDWKEVAASTDAIEYIRHYDHLRQINGRIKTARAALADMEEALSRQEIPDLFRVKQIKTINVEDVGRVTVAHKFSCSIIDKELGYQWLRANDLGGIITETVNSSTMAATAKHRLEDQGLDMPEDLFKVGTVPYTSITKVK